MADPRSCYLRISLVEVDPNEVNSSVHASDPGGATPAERIKDDRIKPWHSRTDQLNEPVEQALGRFDGGVMIPYCAGSSRAGTRTVQTGRPLLPSSSGSTWRPWWQVLTPCLSFSSRALRAVLKGDWWSLEMVEVASRCPFVVVARSPWSFVGLCTFAPYAAFLASFWTCITVIP